jgi:hypothetical protein
MDDNYQKVMAVLIELRTASAQCPHTDDGIRSLMQKYDIMFLGAGINVIYSHELHHALKNYFGIQIELEDLHQMIPALCGALKMTCEPMRAMDDLTNPKPAAYQITLY